MTSPDDLAPPTEHSDRFLRRRGELAARILDHLLSSGRPDTSFRGLAAAAGVTRPTLVHYFTDHSGAVQAAVELAGERGKIWTRLVAEGPDGPPQQLLPMTLKWLVMGWSEGLGRLHHLGLWAMSTGSASSIPPWAPTPRASSATTTRAP